MHDLSRRTIVWTPRILTLLFAAFLSLFALDVFQEGETPGRILLGLAIHLIPVYLVLGVLGLAWRWDWIGAAFFPLLGIWYLIMAWGDVDWRAFLLISGPLFLLGALYLLAWLKGRAV